MKVRVFLILLLVFSAASLRAQDLRQSTATEIQIEGAILTGGFFTTTGGSQVSGIQFYLAKHADSGLPSSSSWSPTVWGGGTHDCSVLHTTDQAWTCELTATDTDTQGWLEACLFITTQAVQNCRQFMISAQASWDVNHAGNVGSSTDLAAIKTQTDKMTFTVANKMDSNVYTWNGTAVGSPDRAGYPKVTIYDGTAAGELDTSGGKIFPAANSITVTEAPNLNATISSRGAPTFKVGTSKQVSLSFKNAGVPVSGQAVSCKIAKDAPISSASGASHNTASTTTDYGSSEITFDGATDLASVTDYMNYHCSVVTPAIAIDGTIYVQQ